MPLKAPGNFSLLEVRSSNEAVLSWSTVPLESVRGELRGYKVQTWTENEGEESMREINIVGANETKAAIKKFIPFSKNYVRILAYNGQYVFV